MPPEVYIVCPKCGHEYNIHKRVYDRGPDFLMFCPLCNAVFPRREAQIAGANVPLGGPGEER
jgi:uncharacterized Zn finger protein